MTTTRQTGSSNLTTVGDTLLERRGPPAQSTLPTSYRPASDEPTDATEETVAPIPYPDKPSSYNPETLEDFIESYERAYRRNDLLRAHGGKLISQGFDFDWTRTLAISDGVGVGRTQYRFNEAVKENDGIVIGDSATHVVTYYVDESVVVRAETTGRREHRDVLVPDPWESGVILRSSGNQE